MFNIEGSHNKTHLFGSTHGLVYISQHFELPHKLPGELLSKEEHRDGNGTNFSLQEDFFPPFGRMKFINLAFYQILSLFNSAR